MQERWPEIKTLFVRALETPAGELGAFLDRACGTDLALRRELESLLAARPTNSSDDALRECIGAEARHMLQRDGANGASDLRHAVEAALAPQYEILRPLGTGGMGAVYLARERALDRYVAIKILRPDRAASEESRERFRREARIAAQLAHPGIVALHSFGEIAGIWYFVMDYVRGPSLAQRLRREGRLPAEEARRILLALAEGLEHSHRRGVIHRDIKPANILLDGDSGRPLLADFGISKIGGTDSLTITGGVVGTPAYMSPEQAQGASDVDERSDIYSLGAVGYAMLTGRETIAAASPRELLFRRNSEDVAPLDPAADSVPAELAAVVMRCLARDRGARSPDARSLHEALERAGDASRSELPASLRDLPGYGAYALTWVVFWTVVAALGVRSLGHRLLLLVLAALVPLGLWLHLSRLGAGEVSGNRLLRIVFWPPDWWGMWWPAPLRRQNDIYRRLPASAHVARLTLTAFFVLLPVLIYVGDRVPSTTFAGESGAAWLLVLGTALIEAACMGWAMRRGLSFSRATHFNFGATAPSPFWDTPDVTRLLAPDGPGVRAPERDIPADYVRAIDELARRVGPGRAAPCADAAASARDVVAAIARIDRDVQMLAHDATASEIERLTARLASLGEAGTQGGGDRAELRRLVQHQLALTRHMQQRHGEALERRTQLLDLLRGLWSQLCRIAERDDNGSTGPTAENGVNRLCTEISAQLALILSEVEERSAPRDG